MAQRVLLEPFLLFFPFPDMHFYQYTLVSDRSPPLLIQLKGRNLAEMSPMPSQRAGPGSFSAPSSCRSCSLHPSPPSIPVRAHLSGERRGYVGDSFSFCTFAFRRVGLSVLFHGFHFFQGLCPPLVNLTIALAFFLSASHPTFFQRLPICFKKVLFLLSFPIPLLHVLVHKDIHLC